MHLLKLKLVKLHVKFICLFEGKCCNFFSAVDLICKLFILLCIALICLSVLMSLTFFTTLLLVATLVGINDSLKLISDFFFLFCFGYFFVFALEDNIFVKSSYPLLPLKYLVLFFDP